MSGDRSVSIVSHYRWDNQVSFPNRGIDFFHIQTISRSHRDSCPICVMDSFPKMKTAGEWSFSLTTIKCHFNLWISLDCVFWVMTPCSLIGGYRSFEEASASIFSVNIPICKTIWSHDWEDYSLKEQVDSSSNVSYLYSGVTGPYLNWGTSYPGLAFHGFLQFFQGAVGIASQIIPCLLSSKSFPVFFIHQSSYHSALYSLSYWQRL